jgi:hypothetical protein
VVMPMARVKHKIGRVRIVRVAAVADDQIAVASVHDDRVEAQETPVATAADDAFSEAQSVGSK